ncbi:MAG: hypothetical protein JF614_21530 [Acidobacteria bacterium]|nr:hypothetical protein [Acidobacteriota bacterium]
MSKNAQQLLKDALELPEEERVEIAHGLLHSLEAPIPKDRKSMLSQARGIWRNRTDLPDFRELRSELDERLERNR